MCWLMVCVVRQVTDPCLNMKHYAALRCPGYGHVYGYIDQGYRCRGTGYVTTLILTICLPWPEQWQAARRPARKRAWLQRMMGCHPLGQAAWQRAQSMLPYGAETLGSDPVQAAADS